METPITPSLPTPPKTEDIEVLGWRRSLLDTFRDIYRCAYRDIIDLRYKIGFYLLTNNDDNPSTILGYGTWILDKTDGDGVRFWRRSE